MGNGRVGDSPGKAWQTRWTAARRQHARGGHRAVGYQSLRLSVGHAARDLPAKSTVYEYFAAWRNDGTWQELLDVLVEHSFAWLGRSSRLRKDYERRVQSSAAMVHLSAISSLLRHLAPGERDAPFKCRMAA